MSKVSLCGNVHVNEDGDTVVCFLPEHSADDWHSDGDEQWRSVVTFEVTVPLVVTVTVGPDGPVVTAAEIEDGFPGFFSEAQDACGVWNPADDVWEDEGVEAVADAAWDFVKSRIPEGWQ